jgi:hypothetical protein
VNGSSRATGVVAAVGLALLLSAAVLSAEEPALRLRVMAIGEGAPAAPWTVELSRWSTEAERAPQLAALSAPPPAPPADAAPGGRAAGRGGRGGRGAPPPSPLQRLASAVKAAPTIGFIWGESVTGYSIKYAWRASLPGGAERVVLVTDRRLGAHAPDWAPSSSADTDAGFTLVEMQITGKGAGEGKTSLTSPIVVDAAAGTLALDGYAAAPLMLKVTR